MSQVIPPTAAAPTAAGIPCRCKSNAYRVHQFGGDDHCTFMSGEKSHVTNAPTSAARKTGFLWFDMKSSNVQTTSAGKKSDANVTYRYAITGKAAARAKMTHNAVTKASRRRRENGRFMA